MTTTTLDRASYVAAADRRATRAVAENTVVATWWVGGWFWAIYAAVLTVLAVVDILAEDAQIRSAAGSFASPWIYLLVMGIVLPAQTSRLHLVAGGTRRTLLQGERWSVVALGATFGLAGWLVLLGRDAAVRALGHDVAPVEGVLVTVGGGAWLGLLVHVLASGAFFATGVLVGHTYRRLGGWLGTVTLPLTLLPAALAVTAAEVAGGGSLAVVDAPAWILVAAGGVVGWLIAWWATWLVVRHAPVQ